MTTKILAYVGDLHINSKVALCTPSFTPDDGDTYRANSQQKKLWYFWRHFWKTIHDAKKEHGATELIGIVNGEVADINKHDLSQCITGNPNDAMRLAINTLQPMIEACDRLMFTRGTAAHSGPASWMDEHIANDLGTDIADNSTGFVIRHPETKHYAPYHWRFTLCGVSFDVAHHAGTGHKWSWSRGGDALRLAKAMMYSAYETGAIPPMIALRGHNHKPSDSGDNYLTHARIMPSWKLIDSFGHRIGASGQPLPVGGGYFVCSGGKYTYHPIIEWPKKEKYHVI